MSRPIRNIAAPLTVLILTAVLGRRVAQQLQPHWGDWSAYAGIGILVCGVAVAWWLRWGRR
ncbi:MAG: hypothetical protein AAFO57_10795 [Pseudomonadota bacterium]